MASRRERSLEIFRNNYNCAQSVFAAYCDLVGVDEATAKKAAAGFGAGIARTQRICGACTGAVMLIGCKHHDDTDPGKSKAGVYEKAGLFLKEFEQLHGSVDCLDLLGEDLNTEEGKAAAKEKNLFAVKCERFVEDAGRLAEKHLH